MKTVNITINGMPLTVPNTYTILEAAREAGFNIPTLCYLKEMNEIGACRICVVEVKGARSLAPAVDTANSKIFAGNTAWKTRAGMTVLSLKRLKMNQRPIWYGITANACSAAAVSLPARHRRSLSSAQMPVDLTPASAARLSGR